MPINNAPMVPRWNQDTGNGTKTSFTYSFKILKVEDIAVYKTLAGEQPDPDSDLVSTDDYTVTGVGNENGGTIDFNVAPANGDIVTIWGNAAYALSTDFAAAKNFSGENLDKAFEEMLYMVQQNKTYIDKLVLTYVKNILLNTPLENVIPPLTKDREIWMRLNNAIAPVVLEENPDVSTLRSELASQTQGGAGASIIGVYIAGSGQTLENYLTSLESRVTTLEQEISGVVIPTGSAMYMLHQTALAGWILADDGTIGSADSNASTRANADTQDLYELIWESVENKWCPIFTDAGVPTSRGASASADFAANKRLALNKNIGRMIVAAQNGMASDIAMTFTTNHPTSNNELTLDLNGGSEPTSPLKSGIPVRLTTTGSLPSGLSTGVTYYITVVNNTKIKLSSSQKNCTDLVYVSVSDNGSGVHTVTTHGQPTYNRGVYGGWQDHLQQLTQLVGHNHDYTEGYSDDTYGGGGTAAFNENQTRQTEESGSSQPFPIIPPFSAWNLFIKL